jgi:hypothetical protein
MNYRNAWNCKRCPGRNDDQGCPAWVEYMQENPATGEQRLQRECLFQALPVFLIEVVKASNRPAAAVESMRNEMVAGLGQVAKALPLLLEDGR